MVDIILWTLVIFNFIFNIISVFLFITLLRGVFRLMDEVQDLYTGQDNIEAKKMDKPQPPPNVVPLEKI